MAQPSAEILFAWVHLSDLHVGRGDAHGRALVLGEIARDLDGGERDWPKLDAILVTGDVAWTGAKSEYDEGRKQLAKIARAAKVEPGSVFVVPGNHDVDRRADGNKHTKRLLKGLRAGEDSLDDALDDDGDRALLRKRLDPYLAFADGLGEGCANLFWARRFEAGGVRVRLVGLNTALAAAQGAGKLWLGTKQIHTALDEKVDDELIVVLSHHPFRGGCLGDEKDADAWVRNHAHLHLFGHVKDAESEAALSGADGHFVRIAAGAASAERGDHGYCVAAIVRRADGSLVVRVWPRRWSDRSKDFRPDVNGVPRGEGFVDRALRWRGGMVKREEKGRKGATAPKPRRPKKALSVWEGPGGVPITEVPHFLGRDEEMRELRAALTKNAAVCVVATGLGGIGKTSLVRQLVAKHGAKMFPDGSVWIDATTLDGDVARVCRRFGYDGERPPTLGEASRFLAVVLHERRVLVVIDNVWPAPIDVDALPIVGGKARTVITSRALPLHESLGVPARPLVLGRWTLEACRAYIRDVVPSLAGASDMDLDALALFVDRLPLAVRLLSKLLLRHGTPGQLLARLKTAPISIMDKMATGADRGIVATFKASLEDFDSTGHRVLLALSACARVTSERVVAQVADVTPQAAADALADLGDHSLTECVSREAGLWSMHDVVRLFVRALPEVTQADDAHLAFAERHVAAHQDPRDWQAMKAGIDEVLTAVDRLLDTGDTKRATSLVTNTDAHMRQRGRYTEILARYERLAERLPAESEELAIVFANAGVFYRKLGDISKAIEHHRLAEGIFEKLSRPDGQADQFGNLGNCYQAQGDIPKAVEHYLRALALNEKLAQPESQATTLSNLGNCYQAQGDIPRAIEHYLRALALDETLGRAEGQARHLGNLGICYEAQGDISKAIDHHERALALDESVGHLEGQAFDLYNLGACHEAQGDFPRAIDHYQRGLALERYIGHSDQHASVREILDALARLGALPTT